jgi:hypothetical protein
MATVSVFQIFFLLSLPLLHDRPPAPQGKFLEAGEECYLRRRKLKILNSGGDMLKKNLQPFLEAQKSVGAESLHEALCRSFQK